MLPTAVAKTAHKRKRVLFPGIVTAAAEFGVSRITLYRVLMGQYPDRQDLVRRYRAFLARK